MRKDIELKRFNQETALATGTLALPPLVIEGLEEFKGSFERLCLRAGTAAIETMLAADAEQFCGMIGSEIGWHGGNAAIRRRRTGASELDGDPEGGSPVALGVQPVADRCGDAQMRALGTTTGR